MWPSATERTPSVLNTGCAFSQVVEPGRRVARVPDREIAVQRGERGLVEDLADQPEVLVDEDVAAVGDRDAGGLLATVLLGEQPEVREPGDVLPGCPDAEQAAFVLR